MKRVSRNPAGGGKLKRMMVAAETDTLFEAVVVPHRSLSGRGLALLIAAICCLSALTSTVFFLLGAWPVAGFSGVEITLAVLLLRLNARARRQSETLLLEPGALRVRRVDGRGGVSERRLDTSWLQVVLQERRARVPALLLSCRGVQEEVARALGEEEKRDLARALAAALYRSRHPLFDNAQLREGQGAAPLP